MPTSTARRSGSPRSRRPASRGRGGGARGSAARRAGRRGRRAAASWGGGHVSTGRLVSLNPRPAGRALATRFAAAHARLLGQRAPRAARRGAPATGSGSSSARSGRRQRHGSSTTCRLRRVDEVALDALAVTLRALCAGARPSRRSGGRSASHGCRRRRAIRCATRCWRLRGRTGGSRRLRAASGVHRNTVLYRLHRASLELGIDPRRPDDALRLLREAEEHRN